MNPYIGPAGEFYVLAALYRRGLDATVTLGTTKSVDIVVRRVGRPAATVEVKTSADKNLNFMVGKSVIHDDPDHFYVFVYFGSAFTDVEVMPEIYVVPSLEMRALMRTYEKVPQMNAALLKHSRFRNGWSALTD